MIALLFLLAIQTLGTILYRSYIVAQSTCWAWTSSHTCGFTHHDTWGPSS